MASPKNYTRAVLLGSFLVLFLCSFVAAAGGSGDYADNVDKADKTDNLVVQPEQIRIYSLFSGSQMHVSAEIPAGSKAVLEVRGKRIEEELMRKSRHWDLWMNSGEVDIDEAPLFYMAFSSEPELLSPQASDLPWGYGALERRAKFTGRIKPVEDVTIFKEFVQLKERDKLYHLYPGGLKITKTNPETWEVNADFRLPTKIKPGRYKAKLSVIQDGKVTETRAAYFHVELAGVPEALKSLAKQHGVFYGFLAVALAMVVGMLTGLAFHRGRGGH